MTTMRRLAIITAALLMLTPTVSAMTVTHDKYEHVSACYGIEMTLAQAKPFNKWKPWQRALFTTAIIGGGKEWYDHNHPNSHTASWSDIAADAVGAFGAEGTLWIVHKTW